MNNEQGRENFAVSIDNEQLRQGAQESKSILHSIGESAKKESDSMDAALLKVGKTIGGVFAVGQITNFARQIVNLRGEIQSLEISFETLAGKSKGDALFKEIREFAVQTPMMVKDLASGAQTMLAFNIDVEKVMPMLKSIGDISMGDAQKFNSLTLAFSQMSATGKLMGQDLLQMINAGFNPLSVIAEKTGKTIGELKEEMEKGKISTQMVTDAFISATSEGGKFNGMLEKQSKGINGAISNMQGAIDDMMNAIGTATEGATMDLVNLGTSLAKNYEQVGRVIAGLIATYGTYKAAVIATTAAESLCAVGVGALTTTETIHYGWLVLVEKAQKLLNLTMLKNPYVLCASALAALVAVMLTAKTSAERMREAEEEYNTTIQETIAKEQQHHQEIEKLCDVASDESLSTDTRRAALVKLIQMYPDLFANYDTEAKKLAAIRDVKKEIAELDGKKSITNTKNELSSVEKRLKELEAKKKTERTVSMTTSAGTPMTIKKGGLSDNEEAELKMLQKKRAELTRKVDKDAKDNFFANLTGVSNDDLSAMIQTRKELLSKMDVSGNSRGVITGEGITAGNYTREELEGQKQLLEAQQAERKKEKKSVAEWAASAESAYQKALKAYNNYRNSVTKEGKEKVTETEADEKLKQLKAELDTAKKTRDLYSEQTDSKAKSAASKAAQEQKRQNQTTVEIAERNKQIEDIKNAQIKANRDAELEARQERLNLEEDSTEKTLQQIDIDKKRMENALVDREDELLEQYRNIMEKQWQNQHPKAKDEGLSFDRTSVTKDDMTAASTQEGNEWLAQALAAIAESRSIMEKQSEKATADAYKAEREAMQSYLIEYGTYLQKKQALTDQYNEKIKNATTEGDKLALKKQFETELSDLDLSNLKVSINWEGVFGNLSNLTKKELDTLKKELETFKNSNEFQLMTPENKKTILDALNEIQAQVNANGGIFGGLSEASKEYKKALEDLAAAQKDYEDALASGNEELIEITKKSLSEQQNKTVNSRTKLTNAQDSTAKKLTTLAGVITELGNASEVSLSGLGNLVSTTTSVFSEAAGKIGGYIGAALSILDSIGDQDIAEWVTGIVEKVFTAVGSIFNSKFSALHYIAGGLIGSSDSNLEKDLEKLAESNDALKASIDRLEDKMSESATADAVDVYSEQLRLLKETIANTQESMAREAAVYNNGFLGIGGKHSSSYYINNALSSSDWARISSLLKKTVNNAGDFFELTVEEMALLADSVPDLYNKIKAAANDGEGDAAQYMDTYISYREELQELQDALNEKLTATTFDTVKDNFKSALLDMESDSDDFAETFETMMQEAVVNSLMDSKYNELIENWYNSFADAMGNDGALSMAEQDNLRNAWNNIVEQATAERDSLINSMGWTTSSSREGSSSGIASASQDSVDELNGRATAIQSHTYNISENTKLLLDTTQSILRSVMNIENETDGFKSRMERVESDIKTMSNTLDDIALRGIKIKS